MNDETPIEASAVARRLGISIGSVYRLARAGVLPCLRSGRSVRFQPAEIEAWIAAGGRAYAGGWRRTAEEVAAA